MWSVVLAPAVPAQASTMIVTSNPQVTLAKGDSLLFYICSGASYPSAIDIVLGAMPLSEPPSSIPGTSGVYMPGMLFAATLESADGSVSIPLIDSNAAHLGLPGGDLVMVPGSRNGGSYSGPIDLISAAANLSHHQATALFASGEAVIQIENMGGSVTFGYPGTPIADDFSASLIIRGGQQSMGARVMSAALVRTPEPGTIGLLLIGLAIMLPRVLHGLRCPARVSARNRRCLR